MMKPTHKELAWFVAGLNRRGFLHATCGAAGALVLGAQASASRAETNSPPPAESSNGLSQDAWPYFRGDPQSRGVAASSLADQLTLQWKHVVDNSAFEGTAAIAQGRVYVGDLHGSLHALDLATGKPQWTQAVNEIGFSSSASWRDQRLYVGDFDGTFYCFDATDGKLVWKFAAGAEINSCANFHGPHVLVGSQDATLYCLDANSGTLRWKYTIDDQIQCSPSIAGNRAFLAGCDARLHMIDLEQGTALGSVELDGPTGATPAIEGSMVYIGTESGTFFGVDWKAAKVVWSHRPERGDTSYRSSAAVTAQHVVIGGRNKNVTSLDPKTGQVQWQFTARRRIDASPVIVGSRVYVGVTDGRLYALSLQSGDVVWEYETGGSLAASPAVAQKRLVIANDNGAVYCFG